MLIFLTNAWEPWSTWWKGTGVRQIAMSSSQLTLYVASWKEGVYQAWRSPVPVPTHPQHYHPCPPYLLLRTRQTTKWWPPCGWDKMVIASRPPSKPPRVVEMGLALEPSALVGSAGLLPRMSVPLCSAVSTPSPPPPRSPLNGETRCLALSSGWGGERISSISWKSTDPWDQLWPGRKDRQNCGGGRMEKGEHRKKGEKKM